MSNEMRFRCCRWRQQVERPVVIGLGALQGVRAIHGSLT